MATDGYKVGDRVIYKDSTAAVVSAVIVPATSHKSGMYVLEVWKDGKRQADVCVQDRSIGGRASARSLAA
jgi:hypothetical protein